MTIKFTIAKKANDVRPAEIVNKIVPEVPRDLGNTTDQISTKKQISPAKRWCFTLNNYTDDEVSSISSIVPEFCSKWIFSKEIAPTTGTPHIQGFFEFKIKKRPIGVFNNKRIKFLKAKGNDLQQVIYIEKEGQVISKYNMPKQPKPIKVINPNRPYQKFIIDLIKEEPDERTIYWFFDREGGCGKTSLCKYLVVNNGAVCLSGKSADVRNGIVEYQKKHGDVPELIVYNVPRSLDKQYLSYEGLENCKDMMFYSGKYEGAMICGNCPHLIVFANEPPNISKLSADRWKVYEINDMFDIHLYEEERINEYGIIDELNI